jgi:hypothetical protein
MYYLILPIPTATYLTRSRMRNWCSHAHLQMVQVNANSKCTRARCYTPYYPGSFTPGCGTWLPLSPFEARDAKIKVNRARYIIFVMIEIQLLHLLHRSFTQVYHGRIMNYDEVYSPYAGRKMGKSINGSIKWTDMT